MYLPGFRPQPFEKLHISSRPFLTYETSQSILPGKEDFYPARLLDSWHVDFVMTRARWKKSMLMCLKTKVAAALRGPSCVGWLEFQSITPLCVEIVLLHHSLWEWITNGSHHLTFQKSFHCCHHQTNRSSVFMLIWDVENRDKEKVFRISASCFCSFLRRRYNFLSFFACYSQQTYRLNNPSWKRTHAVFTLNRNEIEYNLTKYLLPFRPF